jgi:hypothetical protein
LRRPKVREHPRVASGHRGSSDPGRRAASAARAPLERGAGPGARPRPGLPGASHCAGVCLIPVPVQHWPLRPLATQPIRSVVCAHARHSRSLRGRPNCCCSPAAKVPQVECTGDDDAEDEQCLWESHEQAPMTGKLKSQKNQHPKRKGHAQSEPLCLRCSSHPWYQLPVRSRSWALSLSLTCAAVTALPLNCAVIRHGR